MQKHHNQNINNSIIRFMNNVTKIDMENISFCIIDYDENIIYSESTSYLKPTLFFSINDYSQIGIINLLDIQHLNENIIVAIEKKVNVKELLLLPSIENKIDLFFKGHGEWSLFDGLNWTKYYLSNGVKLYNIGQNNWQETLNSFFKPGITYWKNFIQRFHKYQDYLVILDFKIDVINIEKDIMDFQKFAKIFNSPSQSEIAKIKNELLESEINKLASIENILNQIKNKIDGYKKDI